MVQHRLVFLPPAVLLLTIVAVTEIFGMIGIIFAAPSLQSKSSMCATALDNPRTFRARAQAEQEPIRLLPIDAEDIRR